jgi:Mg2+ and Co2+ transporter CorA
MLEDKLPNVSVTKIQVNTKFKPQIEDSEDNRTEIIKRFHDAIHEYIEKCLTENDELEQEIMEKMQDDWLPKKTLEFSDLGEISIQITEEQSVDVQQKDLNEDEVRIYLSKKNITLDKSQTKLNEVTGRASSQD